MDVKTTTTNLGLEKFWRGGPVVDADLATNMDLIDAALGSNRFLKATYDFAVDGGEISDIGLGVSLPDNAIITRAWYDVITTLTSEGTDAATVGIGIPTDDAGGIVAPAEINTGTPWDAGLHEAIQDGTAAAMSVKTTAEREITTTIAVQKVTAGKFNLFVEYVISD